MSQTAPAPNPQCRICNLPLSEGEISLSRQWHFDCERCQLCNTPMPNSDRIRYCLTQHIPPSHITCFQTKNLQELKNELIPITKHHVQAANERILEIREDMTPTMEDYEKLHSFLVATQELAANISWMLKQTKDKISIKDSQEYAEHVRTERKQKSEIASADNALVARKAAERADPTLREKRKNIEQIAKTFGLSFEKASEWFAQNISTQSGKVQ